jgi:biopolymer transport protein ExbB
MNLIALVESGGPVVIVLIALSMIALALTIVKIWQFFQAGVGRHGNIASAVKSVMEGRHEDASRALSGRLSPAARVLRHTIANASRFGVNVDAAREDALRVSQDELRDMRRYLRGVEVIAQSAPLLGLLGTVIGMIQAFSQLEAAGAVVDPSRLAGGIWTALLATALGLAVAIVFSIAGAWLEGRVDNERSVMETTLSGYFASLGSARSR